MTHQPYWRPKKNHKIHQLVQSHIDLGIPINASVCTVSALTLLSPSLLTKPQTSQLSTKTHEKTTQNVRTFQIQETHQGITRKGVTLKKSVLSVRSNETFLLVWFSDRDWSWEKQDSSVFGFKFLRIWSFKRNRTKRMARNYACISGFWIRFEIYMTWHGQCQEFIVVDNHWLLISLGWWISEDKVDS